jgi:hypothetical protein
MGTLNLIVAALNFFVAGMQYGLWHQDRDSDGLWLMVLNVVVGIYCMVSAVGHFVNAN